MLVTHTTYSNAQFDRCGILKLGQGVENFSGQIGHADE
jgi:hypothetical protein